MKIAVDARSLNTPFIRGMGRYVAAVLETMDRTGDWEWCLLGDRPDWPTPAVNLRQQQTTVFEMRGWRFQTWEQYGFPSRSKTMGAQLLFSPNTSLPWWQPLPTVVTVHDTVPWDTNELPPGPYWYWKYLLPRALHKATAIITPSECSRRDLIRLWPRLAQRTWAVPHGLSPEWMHEPSADPPASLQNIDFTTPYFLYLGGPIPRKRLAWAIKVFAAIKDQSCRLLLCGGAGQVLEQMSGEIAASAHARISALPFIPEADLPYLVRHAVAVLYPTLYEGFGFPALEAQAMGTPILFSELGSLAELVGPAAVTLPPEDYHAWVDQCTALLQRRGNVCEPNLAARDWARQFSWEASARRHAEIFQSVMR